MRPYTVKVPAGVAVEIAAEGNYARLKTGAVALLLTSPDASESAELDQGDAVELTPFRRLALSHSDGAEQTFKLYVGKGTRLISSQMSGAVAVSNFPAAEVRQGAYARAATTVLTSGVSVLLAANAARRVCQVQNNSAADWLRITVDGTAPTSALGVRVGPGEVWEPPSGYCFSGALKAIAESGAGVPVEVLEG